MEFGTADDRPGGTALGIVMGTLLSARWRMALATRRSQQQVVPGDLPPIGLMQVLTHVDGIRMVAAVVVHCNLVVVAGPDYVDAGLLGSLAETSSTSKQIDCCFHFVCPLLTIGERHVTATCQK